MDNGLQSLGHTPSGAQRNYASPRKYKLDLDTRTATEVWNFEMGQTINSPICSSVYEDAPLNYLIDYASVGPLGIPNVVCRALGLGCCRRDDFLLPVPKHFACIVAYNSIPLHLENTKFPRVGPQARNLSARGLVSGGDNVLIGGFIISGTEPKTIVLRALGPSLSAFGVPDVLGRSLFSACMILLTLSSQLTTIGKRTSARPLSWPMRSHQAIRLESATLLQNLAPGAYTVVVTGKGSTPGIGSVASYDLWPISNSTIANLSSRAPYRSTGNNVLIKGFIVGDVESATVVVRALGPSLASYGVSDPLSDPTLTIYDAKGAAIATNDNWQTDPNNIVLQRLGLTPPNASESALVLHLPAGAYTAIVRGANNGTGTALAEGYTLH